MIRKTGGKKIGGGPLVLTLPDGNVTGENQKRSSTPLQRGEKVSQEGGGPKTQDVGARETTKRSIMETKKGKKAQGGISIGERNVQKIKIPGSRKKSGDEELLGGGAYSRKNGFL